MGLQHTPAAKEIELKKAFLLGFVFFCCSAVQNYYCIKKHTEIRTIKTVAHICWHKVASNTFTRSKNSFKERLLHILFSHLDQPIFIGKKIQLYPFSEREKDDIVLNRKKNKSKAICFTNVNINLSSYFSVLQQHF